VRSPRGCLLPAGWRSVASAPAAIGAPADAGVLLTGFPAVAPAEAIDTRTSAPGPGTTSPDSASLCSAAFMAVTDAGSDGGMGAGCWFVATVGEPAKARTDVVHLSEPATAPGLELVRR